MTFKDQERVKKLKSLLKDTITLLCKNGLEFKNSFSLEALIGVTLDENNVVLLSINELVKGADYKSAQLSHHGDGDSSEGGDSDYSPRKRRRGRKRGPSPGKSQKGQPNAKTPAANNRRGHTLTDDPQQPASDNDNDDNYDDDHGDGNQNVPNQDSNQGDDKQEVVFVKQEALDDWNITDTTTSGQPAKEEVPRLSESELGSAGLDTATYWPKTAPSAGQVDAVTAGDIQEQLQMSGIPMSQGDGQSSSQQQQMMFANIIPCSICPRTFHDSEIHQRHEEMHRRGFKYNCIYCRKGFFQKKDYEGHMSGHTGQKQHHCQHCDKKYSHKKSLREHMVFMHKDKM